MSRLDEIKARADAATKGPWLQDGPWWTDDGGSGPTALPCVVDASRALVVFPPDATDVGMKRPEDRAANMAFIAAAREDVPWLVERVRACSSLLDSNYDQYMRAEKAEAEVERLTEAYQWTDQVLTAVTAERDALAAKVARVESLAEEWDRMGGFTPNVDLGTFLTPGVNRDALRLFVYRCSPTTASLRPRTSAQAVAGARCIRAALAEPTGPDDLVRCDCGRAVPCRHCEPTGQEGDQ